MRFSPSLSFSLFLITSLFLLSLNYLISCCHVYLWCCSSWLSPQRLMSVLIGWRWSPGVRSGGLALSRPISLCHSSLQSGEQDETVPPHSLSTVKGPQTHTHTHVHSHAHTLCFSLLMCSNTQTKVGLSWRDGTRSERTETWWERHRKKP